MGGLGVAAMAVVAQYGLSYYNAMQEQTATTTSEGNDAFQTFFARRFYDGPFESKMTRREAALILGVRESASPERIKEVHSAEITSKEEQEFVDCAFLVHQ